MKHGLTISTNTYQTYLAKPPHVALKPHGTTSSSTWLSRALPLSTAAIEIMPPYTPIPRNLLYSSQHVFSHVAHLLGSRALYGSFLACRQLLFCPQELPLDWQPLGFPHGNFICAFDKGDGYHMAFKSVMETAQVSTQTKC